MVGPGRPQLVLFGSSIVQQSFKVGGWGAILADLYDRKADIILRGYSGWNSRLALQVLHQIFPKEAAVQPSLVIVYFGGNDAMHPHPSGLGAHVPLPEYVENMKKIYLHLKSLSEKTRIIFLTSPPVNEAMIREHFGNAHDNQDRTNETCHVYAEALVELSKQFNIKVINLCTAIQQRDDWATACLTYEFTVLYRDGIHFSYEGSKIVVKEILKADIRVRGYGGWNSRNGLEVLNQIFPQDADVQNPSLVIVYFCGNDAMQPHPSGLGPHVPLPEYVENMKKIALHIRSLSEETRIIFLTCPPVDEAMIRQYFGNSFDKQERTNEACRIYSEALVELGKQMDIKVINLWTAFQQRDDWAATYLMDGIHLASEGSKIVVKEILKVLREAEWEPSLYWMSMPAEFSEDSPYYSVGFDGKTTVNISDVVSDWKMEWMDEKELEAFILKPRVPIPF
ncbi:hypothetical protein BUALT_Bualt09G0124900 [Buddleja alternifolia]|uniref:SGNH hydrolase-type esterase domain-containing protein n=1 Tax=Buddleja alternifolia TaxID=168488 RepID=A0AAV6X8P2_9LAMI|nr:hypothetical protein BUALT_Bualt09G0124900 [Buddleja alternifolia]